jgi:ParB family chromosome partitioning protein
MEEHGEEPQDEAAYDRLAALQEKIGDISDANEVWSDEQKAIAGVMVTIAHDGSVIVQRGIVKPEDKGVMKKLAKGAGQGGNADDAEAPAKPKGGLPASLIAELTSHKTVAAQLVMAETPDVALLAVTHVLAIKLLYPSGTGEHSSLEINAHEPTFPLAIREQMEKSAPGKKLAAMVKGWQKKLPKKPEDVWAWLEKQKPQTVQSLLAMCARLSINWCKRMGLKQNNHPPTSPKPSISTWRIIGKRTPITTSPALPRNTS